MKKTFPLIAFLLTSIFLIAQGSLDPVLINKLCSKGIYHVENMNENFFPGEELPSMCIPKDNGIPNSYWYEWIIDHPGSIEFTISPKEFSDDLDFELFLVNDQKNQMVRCMASGPNVGTDESGNCLGVTGMLEEFAKIKESLGCDPDRTNLTTPAYCSKGQKYLLRIINFSSDDGFDFELMGTAELKGGEEVSIIHEVESEKIFHFESSTNNRSNIDKYKWDFGLNARPKQSESERPMPISYSSAGSKTILLESWDVERCYSQSAITIDVDENQLYNFDHKDLQCFPNPFENVVNIGISNFEVGENYQLSVWSVDGKLILEKKMEREIESLSLLQLPTGSYLVKVKTDNQEFVDEIIKVNNQGN